jgi:hypothetical protein
MQDVSHGVERNRAWPQKRKKNLPAITKEQNDQFRQYQWATKYWAPQLYINCMNAVKGTPLLPRDLMTAIMANRLCAITLVDGRTMYPMPAVQDVSASLDVIVATPGYGLIRGQDKWEGINMAGPGFGGGWRLIERQRMAVAANAFDFTSISDIYNDLCVEYFCRSAGTEANVQMQLNGDTANNYAWQRQNKFGEAYGNGVAYVEIGAIPNSSAPAGVAAGGRCTIPNANQTDFYKAIYGDGFWMGNAFSNAQTMGQVNQGWWKNTAKVASMKVKLPTNNFVVGSTVTLWGRP